MEHIRIKSQKGRDPSHTKGKAGETIDRDRTATPSQVYKRRQMPTSREESKYRHGRPDFRYIKKGIVASRGLSIRHADRKEGLYIATTSLEP